MKKGNATESLLNTQHFFHIFAENNLGVAEFSILIPEFDQSRKDYFSL